MKGNATAQDPNQGFVNYETEHPAPTKNL